MYKQLRDAGIDPALSQHIAHLFIRDPLVVFDGAVTEVDDETQTDHFESIQSTNWQTVRWKPPPPRNDPNDPHIGWRTEFRSMEMQLTDFENAAFVVFVVLVTRVILAFDLNLYIPLSRVDANMNRAHSRSAYSKAKFFFRRHLAPRTFWFTFNFALHVNFNNSLLINFFFLMSLWHQLKRAMMDMV